MVYRPYDEEEEQTPLPNWDAKLMGPPPEGYTADQQVVPSVEPSVAVPEWKPGEAPPAWKPGVSKIQGYEMPGGTMSTPLPPGPAAPTGGDLMTRAMQYFQPPEYEAIPRQTFQPGWKAAMMDALRGAIPGYTAGQQAQLKAQQQDAMLRNKYRQDTFKERMDFARPLLLKNFEGEAALQKHNSIRLFLDTNPKYVNMPEAEKEAHSWGYKPDAPKQSMEPVLLTFRDGTQTYARWTDHGYVGPDEKLLAPEQTAQIKEIHKIEQTQHPALRLGADPVTGEPFYEHIPPIEKGATTAPAPIRVPGKAYVKTDELAGIKKDIAQLTVEKMQREKENVNAAFPNPAHSKAINFLRSELYRDPIQKIYNDVLPNWSYILRSDKNNPANHVGLITAMALIYDAKTGVRQGEAEKVQYFLQNMSQQLKFNFNKIWETSKVFDQKAIDYMMKAATDRALPIIEEYHSLRNQKISQGELETGQKGIGQFFDYRGKGQDGSKMLKDKDGEPILDDDGNEQWFIPIQPGPDGKERFLKIRQ